MKHYRVFVTVGDDPFPLLFDFQADDPYHALEQFLDEDTGLRFDDTVRIEVRQVEK